jgi:hypothetical protein
MVVNTVAVVVQKNLFHVEKQVEINNIEMGVLENGIPYLTGRGLESMCGVSHGPFHRLTSNWAEEKHKPRGQEILKLLIQANYMEESLFIRAEIGGKEITAFTEPVCLALLEYYAFLSDEPREQAIKAFRTLAKTKFREFVYSAVGYSPEQKMLDSWKHFHDRIDMTFNRVPNGYFSVFNEIASMIVPMIHAGIIVNDKLIPDISVGQAWSSYWRESKLESRHIARINYEHEYPEYYPQAKSNPQPAFAYPDTCLGEFREWFRETYITYKLPTYLLGQVRSGKLNDTLSNKVLQTLNPNSKLLSKPEKRAKIIQK